LSGFSIFVSGGGGRSDPLSEFNNPPSPAVKSGGGAEFVINTTEPAVSTIKTCTNAETVRYFDRDSFACIRRKNERFLGWRDIEKD
jgi:hypothetical protein